MPQRQAIVLATTALAVVVACIVLAQVPLPPLRRLDVLAPAGGHRLVMHDAGLWIAALVVTDLGSPLAVDIVATLAAVAWLVARRWWAVAVVAVARLGELAAESAIKAIVHRPRPDLLPQLTSASGTSFPSGHTAGSAAVYGAIVALLCVSLGRRGRAWATAGVAVFVAAVAASRVLLGVHYPTDVLGGAALGLCWVAVVFALLPRLTRPADTSN